MKKVLLLISCASLVLFGSCKDDETAIDSKAPEIEIISIKDGDIIWDNVELSFNVKDDIGVNKVEVYINGQLLTTLEEKPFEYNWNTLELRDGPYTLKAIVYDSNANKTTIEIKVTVKNTLLALNVDEDYLDHEGGMKARGFIIITDTNGETVVVKEYSNGSQIDIPRPAGFISNEFAITDVVVQEPLNSYYKPYAEVITFFLKDVFEWKLKPYQYWENTVPTIGEAELSFKNIPEDKRGFVSDKYSTVHIQDLSSKLSFPMYQTTTDAILKITKDGEYKFKVLSNILNGEPKEFDLSTTEINVIEKVKAPAIATPIDTWAKIDGFLDFGKNRRIDLVDGRLVDGNIEFNYPKGLLEKGIVQSFRTVFDFDVDDRYYFSEFIGVVPDEVKIMEVDFALLDNALDNFKISVEGDWDICVPHWSNYDNDNAKINISWSVVAGKENLHFKAQDVPLEIKKIFPEFDMSTLAYEGTSVQKNSKFEDYASFIKSISETGDYPQNDIMESYLLLVDFKEKNESGNNERRSGSRTKKLFGQYYINSL